MQEIIDSTMNRPAFRCLWIARELPFPLDSGDRIYSANLARSLANTGAEVHFVGLESDSAGLLPADWGITWHSVPGKRRRYAAAVFSRYPLASAAHATSAFRRTLRKLLKQRWDAVIFDHFGSGWAAREFAGIIAKSSPRPVTAHVSHNYEAALARSLVRDAKQGFVRKLALWQNYLKIEATERWLADHVDLVTTITEEDRQIYMRRLGVRHVPVLTPGYSGPMRQRRTIDRSCPRNVILVGSFRWVVKQENLRQFLKVADPAFAAAGITLDVVGAMPPELLKDLSASTRTVRFHGFVDDLGSLFEHARLALVPEVIGGGFKLKFLDYVFARVPVASLSQALAGLSEALTATIIPAADMADLVDQVVLAVDDDARLNRLQAAAFDTAQTMFNWSDRGIKLSAALVSSKMSNSTGRNVRP